MCYKKPGPRCSSHARTALRVAIDSGQEDRIKEAKRDYMLTPAGIREVMKSDPALAISLGQQRDQMIEESKRVHGKDNADLGEGVHLPKASFRERHAGNVARVARLQREIAVGAQNANEVARNHEYEEVRQYANGYRQAMEDFLGSFGREYPNAKGVENVNNDEEYRDVNRNLLERFLKTEPKAASEDEAYNLGYKRAVDRFASLTKRMGYESKDEDFSLYTTQHLYDDSRGKIDPSGILERSRLAHAKEKARIMLYYNGETQTITGPPRYELRTASGGGSSGYQTAEEAIAAAQYRKEQGISDGITTDWEPVQVVDSRTERMVPPDQSQGKEGAEYYVMSIDGSTSGANWTLEQARDVQASNNSTRPKDRWIVVERENHREITSLV